MKQIIFIFFGIAFFSCAQVGTPSGGPKDDQAPKIIKADPNIGSTNFSGTELKIEFDEFIVLNQIKQEAIISPPSEEDPVFTVSNKTLKVSFDEALLPNTTYTINLGEGVKDFHEGVLLDSNLLVFSTGEYIDSLTVNGVLKDAYTLKPIEKALVLLYESSEDSVPSMERPYYYTRTNKDGAFNFNYLKAGAFSLFALDDQNNNRLYDLPNEQIGFTSERINTQKTDSNYVVKLFQPDNKTQFLISLKEVSPGKLTLIINKPAKNIGLNIIGRTFKKSWFTSDTTLAGDTIQLWTDLGQSVDTNLAIQVLAEGEILDTVSLKLNLFDSAMLPLPEITLNVENGTAKYFNSIILHSSSPIETYLKELLLVIGTNDTAIVGVKQIGSRKLLLDTTLEQEQSYELFMPDSLIKNTLGYYSEQTTVQFKTKSDIEYANLQLEIELPPDSDPVILQMMATSNQIIQQTLLSTDTTLSYSNLSPGNFQFKMIFDKNKDGKWTTGTYIPRTQPERVIFYPEKLEMKEGWDKNIKWVIPE